MQRIMLGSRGLLSLAAIVIRRAGAELALLLSLVGVLVGTVVRTLPGFGWLLAGMVVIGASVTIGNVVTPVVIRRDVPGERVAVVTAAYTATLNVGSLLTTLLTAPVAEVIGWPLALFGWSVLTVAGIAVWSVHLARERRAGGASVALYHTAGKGTRMAPLPGAENNNKPGVKLPALLKVGGERRCLQSDPQEGYR